MIDLLILFPALLPKQDLFGYDRKYSVTENSGRERGGSSQIFLTF